MRFDINNSWTPAAVLQGTHLIKHRNVESKLLVATEKHKKITDSSATYLSPNAGPAKNRSIKGAHAKTSPRVHSAERLLLLLSLLSPLWWFLRRLSPHGSTVATTTASSSQPSLRPSRLSRRKSSSSNSAARSRNLSAYATTFAIDEQNKITANATQHNHTKQKQKHSTWARSWRRKKWRRWTTRSGLGSCSSESSTWAAVTNSRPEDLENECDVQWWFLSQRKNKKSRKTHIV